MYNKNVAITGSTIEKTTKYDQFREDKIRMELYRIILSLYNEGYRTFTCNQQQFRYDDLIKQADNKKILPEKEFFGNALVGGHIICYYDDFSTEMQQIYASGTPYTNICKMI